MVALAARKWYSTALAVAVLAIVFQLVGKHYCGRAMTTAARSAEALNLSKQYADSGSPSMASAQFRQTEDLMPEALKYARQADLWRAVSFGLALGAATYWVFAIFDQTAGNQKALLALLAVYCSLLLIQV
jgi:hypothetical protein